MRLNQGTVHVLKGIDETESGQSACAKGYR